MPEILDLYDKDGNRTGETIVRGTKIPEGRHVLLVSIVTVNGKGEILLSKRAPGKTYEGCWEVTTDAVSGEYKFRANHDWGINWGGTESDLTQDGANLNIEAGTYKFQLYLTYAGNNRVVITKQ